MRTAIRALSRPLDDLIARAANDGDTRLIVTGFRCEASGYDKSTDQTTEYHLRGEFADYGVRIDHHLSPSSSQALQDQFDEELRLADGELELDEAVPASPIARTNRRANSTGDGQGS